MWLEHLDVFNISLVQLDPSPSKCIQVVQTSLECSKACKTFVLQKVGWLDYYCASWRPEWTLTFWVNQTFWDGFQHNPKPNDLTKIKPSLIWKNQTFFITVLDIQPLIQLPLWLMTQLIFPINFTKSVSDEPQDTATSVTPLPVVLPLQPPLVSVSHPQMLWMTVN